MTDEKTAPTASPPSTVAPAPTAQAPAPSTAAPPAKPAGPPPVKVPPLVPFVAQPDRATVDQGEPAADGSRPVSADREWIGYAQQGGGKVPEDWMWPHSPKQEQDESM